MLISNIVLNSLSIIKWNNFDSDEVTVKLTKKESSQKRRKIERTMRKNIYKLEKWKAAEEERDKKLEQLKQIKELEDVFTVKLGKEHRIHCKQK